MVMGRPVIFWNRKGWLIRFEGVGDAVLVNSLTHVPRIFAEAGSAAKRLFDTLGCAVPVTVEITSELDIDLSPLPLLYQF